MESRDVDKMTNELETIINDTESLFTQNTSSKKNSTGGEPSPSFDFDAVFSGINNMQALNFLFSGNMDRLIDSLFQMINSGKFNSVSKTLEKLAHTFTRNGVVTGETTPFRGKITRNIMNVIKKSTESIKFNKIKSQFRRLMLISRNLSRYAKSVKDSEERKKYEDAIHTLTKAVKLVYKIYKSRKVLSDKFLSGLDTLVNEQGEPQVIEVDLGGWW